MLSIKQLAVEALVGLRQTHAVTPTLLLSTVLLISHGTNAEQAAEKPAAEELNSGQAEAAVRATALGAIVGTAVGVGVLGTSLVLAQHISGAVLLLPFTASFVPLAGTLGAAVGLYAVDVWAPGVLLVAAVSGGVALLGGAGLGFVAYWVPSINDRWQKACCGGESDGGNGLYLFVPLGAAALAAVAVPTATLVSAGLSLEE